MHFNPQFDFEWYLQACGLLSANSFNTTSPGETDEFAKLGGSTVVMYPRASYINHSCVPNATFSGYFPEVVVKASTRITKGEQIFISYVDDANYDLRNHKLFSLYGFKCKCSKCTAES